MNCLITLTCEYSPALFVNLTVKKNDTCIVPLGFLPWENVVAFPGASQLRQSRATQPRVHAECCSVSLIHRILTWTTGSLTCAQMLMHVTAHRGVWTPQASLH